MIERPSTAPTRLLSAHLHEPPEAVHLADEWWLEPFLGDVGAERDEARHTDYGAWEDW